MLGEKICILGSTGSIGKQALEVIKDLQEENNMMKVVGLASSGSNMELFENQVKHFNPSIVAIYDKDEAYKLKSRISSKIEVLSGMEGVIELAKFNDSDVVLAAISGFSGLLPAFEAVKAGKNIALANKESLVAAGNLFMEEVESRQVKLVPVDSEHSAIYQCLEEDKKALKSIILTASGGALRDYTKEQLLKVTPQKALNHPNWDMGKKITIDSATLMNKGLEVIEAYWLFDVDYENIEVIIHPQSIVHSMVRYVDGSILAHLGIPDMRVAIQYALTWPERKSSKVEQLDFLKNNYLTFEEPRWDEFPCLQLAYEAGKLGGNMPAVLNASNEAAVELFLEEKIDFYKIPLFISKALESSRHIQNPTLQDIIDTDLKARETVKKLM